MSTPANSDTTSLKEQILSNPGAILDDQQIVEALIGAQDAARGGNVVDMRGAALSHLEARLTQVKNTHQQVVSTAYDNVTVTAQVHRSLLFLTEPLEFDAFIEVLGTQVRDCLQVRAIRVVMEAEDPSAATDLNDVSGVLSLVPPGFVQAYRVGASSSEPRPIILRTVSDASKAVYGTAAADVRSEAVVLLNFGAERAPGLLVLGADDAESYAAGQATDLLNLFSRVCERLMRSWLG